LLLLFKKSVDEKSISSIFNKDPTIITAINQNTEN
jgi:hypothetical protein